MNDTEERVDLSDLDLLDDKRRHARCTYCQPLVGPLEPFDALCGVRAISRGVPDDSDDPPPNACGPCKDLWHQPCVRCGH
jgi:hypothetical protein